MTTSASTRFGAAAAGSRPPELAVLRDPPPAPKHRWRTVALVLLVLAGLAGAVYGGRVWGGHGKHEVWALRTDLSAGATITPQAVTRITVMGAAADRLVPASRPIVGQVLNRTLPAGSTVPEAAVGGVRGFPAAGQRLVGVGLPDGGAPDGLHPGSIVTVLALPAPKPDGSGPTAATSQVVLSSIAITAVRVTGGGEVVTLLVPAASTPEIAALSAQQRVALTLVRS